MLMLWLIFSQMTGLILLFYLLMFVSSIKTTQDSEKLSPFECGFIPAMSTRTSLSLHFFLIAMVFLIFDMELIILFPLLFSSNFKNLTIWTSSTLLFFSLLTVGTFIEWSQKNLNWVE